MSWNFNPFLGVITQKSSKATDAETALKVQEEFDNDGPVQVGSVVVPSSALQDTVRAIDTNYNYPSAAFGVVTEIVSPTRCKVLISGKLSGSIYQLAGLTFGKTVFIGADGKLTTTPPASGPLQKMGIALKSDSIFLLPNLDIINRV